MHCISVNTFIHEIIISLRKLYIKAPGIFPGTVQTSFISTYQEFSSTYFYIVELLSKAKVSTKQPRKKVS